mmetsp:Transcript_6625/g.19100  ORF Transcript_6625/g.19100 Transcript_6625/m.19100 type:complete len:272 (+) Transcript_6625:787-1602(+)
MRLVWDHVDWTWCQGPSDMQPSRRWRSRPMTPGVECSSCSLAVGRSVSEVRGIQNCKAGSDAALIRGGCLGAQQMSRLLVQEHLAMAGQVGAEDTQLRQSLHLNHLPLPHHRRGVNGWPDALHEDVCRQPLPRGNLLCCLLPVQVVTAALPLRLEHVGIRVLRRCLQHLSRACLLQVVQTPQPSEAGTQQLSIAPGGHEAFQDPRPRQILLHLLRAGELEGHGRALDGAAALQLPTPLPLHFAGVVIGGVSRPQIHHPHPPTVHVQGAIFG